jgi:hypothetical protein
MAGILHLEEFKQPTLRGLVDETVQDKTPSLGDGFLPDVNTYSTKFAYDVIKNNKYIAAMIGYGSEPPVIDRDAVASMSGELAKMGLKYIATEEELLALNQARSASEKGAMIDSITLQAVKLVQAMQRRVDVTKMEAITKGTFVYNKNGVKVNLNFGVPANHKVALTAGNDWNVVGHDVIGDLLAWADVYETSTGRMPENILMSRQAFGKMTKNTQIIVEAGRPTGVTRASEADVQAVVGSYGLPSITIVGDRKVTVKNVYTGADEVIEFMPEARVVFVSAGLGEFLYGPTVENNFEPGIALNAYDKDEPIQSIIRAVATGFPAIKSPELLFHADVYTA